MDLDTPLWNSTQRRKLNKKQNYNRLYKDTWYTLITEENKKKK